MIFQRLNVRGASLPELVDRRADVATCVAGGALPRFAVLGAGCWASEGNVVAWRFGLRLLFTGRGPARRLIWRDESGPTFAEAAERLRQWWSGSIVHTIEVWSAQRLRDVAIDERELRA